MATVKTIVEHMMTANSGLDLDRFGRGLKELLAPTIEQSLFSCRLKVRKHTHWLWKRLSNGFLTYPKFEPVDSLTVAHSTPLLEERRTRKNLYNQAREVILTFRSQFSQFGLSAWEPNALSQNLSSHALIMECCTKEIAALRRCRKSREISP